MAQSCHSALNRSIESCILGLMQQTMSKGMNANADNVRAKQKKLQQQNVAAVLLIGRGITDSGAAAYLPARKRSKQLYANAALRWDRTLRHLLCASGSNGPCAGAAQQLSVQHGGMRVGRRGSGGDHLLPQGQVLLPQVLHLLLQGGCVL